MWKCKGTIFERSAILLSKLEKFLKNHMETPMLESIAAVG